MSLTGKNEEIQRLRAEIAELNREIRAFSYEAARTTGAVRLVWLHREGFYRSLQSRCYEQLHVALRPPSFQETLAKRQPGEQQAVVEVYASMGYVYRSV